MTKFNTLFIPEESFKPLLLIPTAPERLSLLLILHTSTELYYTPVYSKFGIICRIYSDI